MHKCLPLNLLQPTKVKRKLLEETYRTFLSMVRELLPLARRAKTSTQLHHETYKEFRGKYGIASQLVIEARRYAWNHRKTIKETLSKCIVRFDRRLFSFQQTKRENPVLTVRTNHQRIGIPISQDGAYQRLQQHLEDGWTVTSIIMKRKLKFQVVLFKDFPEPDIRPNWMGIDINSSKIAVSIISQNKVLKQTYFGQDVSVRQFRLEERRAKLQAHRDNGSKGKAGLKLKRLSGKQRNYVRTRLWQIANETVKLAEKHNANIAIERLRRLRKHKGEWNRKSTRKVNRIPYGFFKYALKHVAEREGVAVKEVKAHYTSQICPQCGFVGRENWKGYSYFKCLRCGYEADRDRTASLNIAERADSTFTHCSQKIQFPLGNAPVNEHIWKDERCVRQRSNHLEFQALSERKGAVD